MRRHGRGGDYFRLAELLSSVPSQGRHLKPLGKPAQNARKWFATVEIERMSCDSMWLDKAIRIVEKQIQEMNTKQRDNRVKCIAADEVEEQAKNRAWSA